MQCTWGSSDTTLISIDRDELDVVLGKMLTAYVDQPDSAVTYGNI
jgi:hypothetical protein